MAHQLGLQLGAGPLCRSTLPVQRLFSHLINGLVHYVQTKRWAPKSASTPNEAASSNRRLGRFSTEGREREKGPDTDTVRRRFDDRRGKTPAASDFARHRCALMEAQLTTGGFWACSRGPILGRSWPSPSNQLGPTGQHFLLV
jgi:hypothetical protein